MKSHRTKLIDDLPLSRGNSTLQLNCWNRIKFGLVFDKCFEHELNENNPTSSAIASFVKGLNEVWRLVNNQSVCVVRFISTSALVCVCIQKRDTFHNFCHESLPRGTLWQVSFEHLNTFRCINSIENKFIIKYQRKLSLIKWITSSIQSTSSVSLVSICLLRIAGFRSFAQIDNVIIGILFIWR